MERTVVDRLTITNVWQKRVNEKRIDIHFTIEDMDYYLTVMNIDNTYKPWAVYHNSVAICSFCRKRVSLTFCDGLGFDPLHLFHRLIEFPSIRLEWLYLKY